MICIVIFPPGEYITHFMLLIMNIYVQMLMIRKNTTTRTLENPPLYFSHKFVIETINFMGGYKKRFISNTHKTRLYTPHSLETSIVPNLLG